MRLQDLYGPVVLFVSTINLGIAIAIYRKLKTLSSLSREIKNNSLEDNDASDIHMELHKRLLQIQGSRYASGYINSRRGRNQ